MRNAGKCEKQKDKTDESQLGYFSIYNAVA